MSQPLYPLIHGKYMRGGEDGHLFDVGFGSTPLLFPCQQFLLLFVWMLWIGLLYIVVSGLFGLHAVGEVSSVQTINCA